MSPATRGSASAPRQFFGKYRGLVVDNNDPEKRGRLQVKVPAVMSSALTTWALPCLPAAFPKGGLYVVPPKQAQVWVEFEGGSPESPIWSGCFWNARDAPAEAAPTTLVLRLGDATATIVEDNGKATVTLKVGGDDASTVKMTADELRLSCGKSSIIFRSSSLALKVGTAEISMVEKGIGLECGKASIELDGNAGDILVNGPSLLVKA